MDPPKGWISPHYGELFAAPFLQYTAEKNRNAFAYLIDCGCMLNNASIQVETFDNKPISDKTLCFVITESDRVDYLIVNRDPANPKAQFKTIEFDGNLLWLKTIAGTLTNLRWISGRSVKFQGKYEVRSESYLEEVEITTAKDGAVIYPQNLSKQLSIKWIGTAE